MAKSKSEMLREFAAANGIEIVELKIKRVSKAKAAQAMVGIPTINESKMVERETIFGQKFMEAEDTPFACSPRSEAYWSM